MDDQKKPGIKISFGVGPAKDAGMPSQDSASPNDYESSDIEHLKAAKEALMQKDIPTALKFIDMCLQGEEGQNSEEQGEGEPSAEAPQNQPQGNKLRFM